MRTFYCLCLMITTLCISLILISDFFFWGKIALILLSLSIMFYEINNFSVKSLDIQGEKLFLHEKNAIYAVSYLKSSVITSSLCFLHVKALEGNKKWFIPLSRLELSKESFWQLKFNVQQFLIR